MSDTTFVDNITFYQSTWRAGVCHLSLLDHVVVRHGDHADGVVRGDQQQAAQLNSAHHQVPGGVSVRLQRHQARVPEQLRWWAEQLQLEEAGDGL